MKLLFDNDGFVELDFFTEHPIDKRLSGNNVVYVSEGSVFPDLSHLKENFTTVKCVNGDNVEIPLLFSYTRLANISTSYQEDSKAYTVNIVLE